MFEHSTHLKDMDDHSHSAPTAPTSLPVGNLISNFEIQAKNCKAFNPVHSVGSIVGTEVHPETDESVWSDSSRGSCIFAEDEELEWAEHDTKWSWVGTELLFLAYFTIFLIIFIKVEAGACYFDTSNLPNWFGETGLSNTSEFLEQPWRVQILQNLQSRLPLQKVFNYEQAVDTTSWVHKGEARVDLSDLEGYVDCMLQLEWVQNTGTLTIINPDGATTMVSRSN